ncbi:hypothetical protein BH10BAC4_BH10BAC4_02380 [soil metagenome]
MGKPFESELTKVRDTLAWAEGINIDEIKKSFVTNSCPFFIVGSGGSFSACVYAEQLLQKNGLFAKAITPLDLIYNSALIRKSNVLLLSAGGRNKDILFAFKMSIEHEAKQVVTICLTLDAPLTILAKGKDNCKAIEFANPAGKDGFLATNSLVAYFVLLNRLLNNKESHIKKVKSLKLDGFISTLPTNPTYLILYGGYGRAVAVDLESKFSEAALGNITIADYRNFGHGRHHWLAKRGKTSVLIAITTPSENEIAEKTLSLIPDKIPRLTLKTDHTSSEASIDLLIQSFDLVNSVGKVADIDPGRPGVPSFGSKLYRLNPSAIYRRFNNQESFHIPIIRKAEITSITQLSDSEFLFWKDSYFSFLRKMSEAKFGAIVLDYDGTICDSKNRFERKNLPPSIKSSLLELLKKGFIIGIISGRGKSTREIFQNAIDKRYWNQIIMGYYNGAEIGLLSDDRLPDGTDSSEYPLNSITAKLKESVHLTDLIKITSRRKQVTIEVKEANLWPKIKPIIFDLVVNSNFENIKVLVSSHSMDIIIRPDVSKLNILSICQEAAIKRSLSMECLCIGDRGKFPGNDFELLATPYSISVDEVSSDPSSGWNMAQNGIRGVDALNYYLSKIKRRKKSFSIKLD